MRSPARAVVESFLILVPICVLALGCARDVTTEPQPIRLGFLGTLTGEVERDGHLNLVGARLAIDEINQRGGLEVDGRLHPVELVVGDTANTPEAAIRGAQQMINDEKVIALVGPFVSSTAIPVAQLAESSNIVMITPMASHPDVTRGKSWVFRACFDDLLQGELMARFARDDLGASKAAILFDQANPYSAGLAEIFREQFEDGGGTVVGSVGYTADELEFSATLSVFDRDGAEVLFLPNFSEHVRLQAQQARRAGLEATLLGSDIWNEALLARVPEVDGSFKVGHWHPGVAGPEARSFLASFHGRHGSAPDISRAALAYDAVGLVAHAIEKSGALDSSSIRAAIAEIDDYQGVTGTISYRGSGDPQRSAVIIQLRDGVATAHRQVDPR